MLDKADYSKIVKLNYLINAVEGSAEKKLSGIKICEENLDIAWKKIDKSL